MNFITKTLNSITNSRNNDNPDNFSIDESKRQTTIEPLSQSVSLYQPQTLSKKQSITKKNIRTPILSAATIIPKLSNDFNTINESPKIAVSQSKTIFFIILFTFLAFIGYNIFTYLSQGSSYIIDLLKPIFNSISLLTGNTLNSSINNTLTGTNKSIDITSDTTKNILNNATIGSTKTIDKIQNKPISNKDDNNDDDNSDSDNNPKSISSAENSNSFCYIGKINDTRYCAKVLDDKYCLSEEIFPTMDLCINPKLRN